jgi:hypothetical protein
MTGLWEVSPVTPKTRDGMRRRLLIALPDSVDFVAGAPAVDGGGLRRSEYHGEAAKVKKRTCVTDLPRRCGRVYAKCDTRPMRQYAVVGQLRIMVVGTAPITDAIPSVSIVFKASASAALSFWKDSSQIVEFPNSSTTSNNHPPCPSS